MVALPIRQIASPPEESRSSARKARSPVYSIARNQGDSSPKSRYPPNLPSFRSW